jgi:hypothetical protein
VPREQIEHREDRHGREDRHEDRCGPSGVARGDECRGGEGVGQEGGGAGVGQEGSVGLEGTVAEVQL